MQSIRKEEFFHHYSDLYIFATPLTQRVVNQWCKDNGYHRHLFVSTFRDQITGRPMYDCAFQYARGIDVETLYKAELKWTAVAIRYYVQALNKEVRWQSCGRNEWRSSNRSWKTLWRAATENRR